MADITLLTPEQLAERDQKRKGQGRSGRHRSPERTRIIEGYKATLQHAEPGSGGDVLLAEGEDKRAVRLNLKAAADELGKALDFRPIKDKSRLHFRVITLDEQAARPKRGGRPRKTIQVPSTADEAREQPQASLPELPAAAQEQSTGSQQRRMRRSPTPTV